MLDNPRAVISCCACGVSFAPRGNGRRCPPCRNQDDRARRAQRREDRLAAPPPLPQTPGEEWRRIDGWPQYAVSSLGRVRHQSGRILKGRPRRAGYLRVTFVRGKPYDFEISRLVVAAFHGPAPGPNHDADHINRIVTDNRAVNLRWLPHADNLARRICAFGERHAHARLTIDAVREIRACGHAKMDRVFAARFDVSRETVRDARLGKLWRHVDV